MYFLCAEDVIGRMNNVGNYFYTFEIGKFYKQGKKNAMLWGMARSIWDEKMFRRLAAPQNSV